MLVRQPSTAVKDYPLPNPPKLQWRVTAAHIADVTEAGLVTHQHRARAECVPVGAAGGRLGYPLPFGRSDELTLHHSVRSLST
jgi:hypothetical protein